MSDLNMFSSGMQNRILLISKLKKYYHKEYECYSHIDDNLLVGFSSIKSECYNQMLQCIQLL